MIRSISYGINHKPQATLALSKLLRRDKHLTGQLIFGNPTDQIEPKPLITDAVLVSDQGQITVLHLIERSSDFQNYQYSQDRARALVKKSLEESQLLVSTPQPKLQIATLTFGPDLTNDQSDPNYPIVNAATLIPLLIQLQSERRNFLSPSNSQDVANILLAG